MLRVGDQILCICGYNEYNTTYIEAGSVYTLLKITDTSPNRLFMVDSGTIIYNWDEYRFVPATELTRAIFCSK